MGMTYKEGKTQDSRKGSNFFILLFFWVTDILYVSNSENSPFKTNFGQIHLYSNLI